jgi:small-conductance mechanosensitive channel
MVGLVVYLGGIAAAVPLIFQLSSEARLALGGALAVAIGIALRDLVASIIAGITILLDKPFSVGDRITYGDVYGEVVEIGLRAVRVMTLDNELVTIPNSRFITDLVASGNAGQLDKLVSMDFFIGVDQDLQAAKRIVGEALASSRYTYLKKPWRISIRTVQESDFFAVRLRAKVFVLDVRYERALETDVTERVIEAFRQQRIAGPIVLQRDLP